MPLTIADLRRHAITRTFFTPTTLPRALRKLGFVQADPIRAPARAQDLTLRHRVVDYRAGDLERAYAKLRIEEDFFVNYGFVSRELHALMHPRTPRHAWSKKRREQAAAVLEFMGRRRAVHPREVEAAFEHGKTTNWFGGSSNASTQLLDEMHYRGLVRVVRREGGTRVYAARPPSAAPDDPAAVHDALIDVIVEKYAPLPFATLGQLVSHLGIGVPQWRGERGPAMKRALERLASERIDGVRWYWPADERIRRRRVRIDDGDGAAPQDGAVRLLAPFDPLVWDRRRFELFWGWAYRFEAYTPAPKRKLGYYALPLLWNEQVVGWGNLSRKGGTALTAEFGYVDPAVARDRAFKRALDAELDRMRRFLGGESATPA